MADPLLVHVDSEDSQATSSQETQSLEQSDANPPDQKPEEHKPLPEPAENSKPTERSIVTLKLDTVQLPDFSGDLTNWEAFRDMFEYLVDKSTKLSDIVKFHQLRSHLKGQAFDTIRGYQLTGANYKSAWSDVKRRYDRKEEIIDEYIRKFLEMSAISKANSTNLSHLVDTTNQMLRALPNLGVNVSTWDPFLHVILESKLDNKTQMDWKQKRGPHQKPNIVEFVDWLEIRAIELQPSVNVKLV